MDTDQVSGVSEGACPCQRTQQAERQHFRRHTQAFEGRGDETHEEIQRTGGAEHADGDKHADEMRDNGNRRAEAVFGPFHKGLIDWNLARIGV